MDPPVAPVVLNVAPLNAPQRELEWQPWQIWIIKYQKKC
jgi:hypothetical protein